MDRRRAAGVSASRYASSGGAEEVQYWSKTVSALEQFISLHSNPSASEQLLNVNRLIAEFPTDEQLDSGDSYDSLKPIRHKFTSGLETIKDTADKEIDAIDAVMEHLEVLIALRSASEAAPQDKRNKRLRLGSPATAPATPQPPARSSLGPGGGALGGPSHSKMAKQRHHDSVMSRPERLEPGRKVAFHQPPHPDPETGEMMNDQWILAVVKRHISSNKYEVEDADEEGTIYTATLDSIIALPDPEAHPASFPEYPVGQIVLGMYPDTTVFYRSTIVDGPKRYPAGGGARTVSSAKSERSYKIKFEDDNDDIRIVPAHFVVAVPNIG